MKNKLVYIVGGNSYYDYVNWILAMDFKVTNNIALADLVLFAGGEDVTPSLYSKDPDSTSLSTCNIARDVSEIKEYTQAKLLGKKMIGICRGSQFLCAMAGGDLVQHMNHPSIHNIETIDGQTIEVTSSHHQQQYPFNMDKKDYQILGYCELTSVQYLNSNKISNIKLDVENCWYKNINALGIQSHPEWQDLSGPSIKYFQKLLKGFLNDTGIFDENYEFKDIVINTRSDEEMEMLKSNNPYGKRIQIDTIFDKFYQGAYGDGKEEEEVEEEEEEEYEEEEYEEEGEY